MQVPGFWAASLKWMIRQGPVLAPEDLAFAILPISIFVYFFAVHTIGRRLRQNADRFGLLIFVELLPKIDHAERISVLMVDVGKADICPLYRPRCWPAIRIQVAPCSIAVVARDRRNTNGAT